MAHYRKIIVNDQEFQYHIGFTGIKIRSKPAFFISMDKFTGRNWWDLEKSRWKGCAPEVGPADVKRLIIENKLIPA